jgi:O-antigen ligase
MASAERTSFIIYLSIIILSIVFFGAVHTYMYTFMIIGVLVAAVFGLFKAFCKEERSGRYFFQVPWCSWYPGFAALFLFLVFQMVPLPQAALNSISPESMTAAERSVPAADVVLYGQSGVEKAATAPYTYPVRLSIIRLTTYGLFFFGLIQVLNPRKRINAMIAVLLSMACLEALYGLMETFSESYHILWHQMAYGKERVRGTYINSNHFAGLMTMAFILAAALAGGLSKNRNDRTNRSRKAGSLRARIAAFTAGERHWSKRLLVCLAGAVIGVGLVFSASRGGILSWAVSMLLMGILLSARRGHRRNGLVLIGIFALVLLYALKIGVEYPIERFKKFDITMDSRYRYAVKTMGIFEDFTITGSGVGSFQYIYPAYQSQQDAKRYFVYAHNDWAQFLAEAGVLGMSLLLCGAGYYLYRTFRMWKRRRDPYAVSLGMLPPAVFTAMAVHSYSDFNLHIPANVLVLLAVTAAGHAALHLDRHHRRPGMLYRYFRLPVLSLKGVFVLAGICTLILWTGVSSIRHFLAEAHCNTVANATLHRDPRPPFEDIQKAVHWDPENPEYRFKLAQALSRKRQELVQDTRTEWTVLTFRIVNALEEAVRLNPFDAQYHMRLGWEYFHLFKAPDYNTRWLPAADISMERASSTAGVKTPYLHQQMGNYWSVRYSMVPPGSKEYRIFWNRAQGHYALALEIERGRSRNRMEKQIAHFISNLRLHSGPPSPSQPE